ncbi:IS4 family transposase, partial [Rhizobium sp. R634]|uniref:IS4 family transposase n=1 Tax=Rhizobium sp. R634 TaxID=1764274 RepID=UPI001FD8CA7B
AMAFTHLELPMECRSDSVAASRRIERWMICGWGGLATVAWKKGAFLLERLVSTAGQGVRVRKLGGNRAGEIRLSRFLRNGAVDPQAMIDEAALRTAGGCADRHILAIQDTTVVRSDGGGGLYLHAMIGVDADDGAIVGAIHGQFLSRDQGKRGTQRARPIEEKESYRWLEGADQAAKVCAAARHITVIADRESDIYEAFTRRPANVELVVRAAKDRSFGKDQPSLFAMADALPVAAKLAFTLPAKPGRKQRDTQLAIRFSPVALPPPKNGIYKKTPDGVRLYLVDVRETAAPAGETPIHWRLLTTYAVSEADEAAAVIALYRRRWTIEQLFRTLKTQGFDIEGLRIEDEGALSNLVMAAFVAAVIVQQLVHARDGPARRCLAPHRGRLRAKRPAAAGSLLRQAGGQHRQTEEPASQRLACLCRLGLRPPRWMDRLLRKAWTNRHARRMAPVPGHQTRRRPPLIRFRQCVNLIAPLGRRCPQGG